MPNLVGIGNSQVPTNAMLGGLAYQDSVDVEKISKIKAKTSDTAVDIFVYDTRKDSDGGAWRHRTQGTSWYTEGASSIRGARKEFPTVAIIIAETTQITIYDGDDPNCPMWMVFNRGADASPTSLWDGNNGNNCTAISAKNGLVMWTTHTAGSYGADFIGERWIYFYNAANTCGYRDNGKGIADRNNAVSSRTAMLERFTGYARYHAHRDIAMTVLPNARVDNVTGLPSPTVAVATDEGVDILQSNKVVSGYRDNHGGSYNQVMYVDFDTETNAVIFSADYGDGGGGAGQYKLNVLPPENQHPYEISTAVGTLSNTYTGFQYHSRRVQTGGNDTVPKIRGNYIRGLISAGYAKYGFITGDSPTTFYPTVYNLMREYDGVDTLQNPTYPSLSQIAYIGSDYNSGWLFSDVRGAFLADTLAETSDVNYALTATAGSTNRLTSHTYDSGDTSWQMVDNAASTNGYIVIEMKGLTVGQKYKITMTWSSNAALDSGYNHRVAHKNGAADENDTNFEHWNKTNGSSETLIGGFVAQSTDSDDIVMYANAITLNVSNFKIEETDDAVAKNLISNGNFHDTSGWVASNATLSVSSNKLRILTNSQGYAYAAATTVAGKQYVLSLNLETDGNSSLWVQIGSSAGGLDVANINPFGEGIRHGVSVMAKSTTTYISLKVSTAGSSKDIYVSDVVFEEAERDHATSEYDGGQGSGLRVIGTVPKQVVNPGCDLVSYGPFSLSNYLQCPNNRASYTSYNKFDDFGTNSMWGMAWINMTQYTNTNCIVSGFSRSSGSNSDNQRWAFYVNGNGAAGNLGFYQQNGGTNNNNASGLTMPLNAWNHVAFARLSQNSGELHFFVNGVHTYNNGSVANLSLSNVNMAINIGADRCDTYPSDNATGSPFAHGKMALLRIGRGELTVDIAKQIYEDEKELFVENAKCTLYGTSDLVTAQAYDSTRDVLHLGTSAGRSDFVGLRRINNTTTAVTTAISASDGLIAEQ